MHCNIHNFTRISCGACRAGFLSRFKYPTNAPQTAISDRAFNVQFQVVSLLENNLVNKSDMWIGLLQVSRGRGQPGVGRG